uniref:Uncharacterized protein n=1 Tax=Parascaris equorum TaxID=6256 RepID=A0A914S3E8_PAREQ
MNKVVTKGSLSPSFSNASECSKEDEFSQVSEYFHDALIYAQSKRHG